MVPTPVAPPGTPPYPPGAAEFWETCMPEDLKQLPISVTIIATSFAFAYDIGYFSAIDINRFTFFTLPEHVLFAIQAFLIALGALIIFMTFLGL